MSNDEILQKMKTEPMNLLFKRGANQISFLEYLKNKHVFWSSGSYNELLGRRHLTFFYEEDLEMSSTVMYGTRQSRKKNEYYYEDLFSSYKVDLI